MSIFESLGKPQKIRHRRARPDHQYRTVKEEIEGNLTRLNNLGREQITRDFTDSPHADRVPERDLSTENED